MNTFIRSPAVHRLAFVSRRQCTTATINRQASIRSTKTACEAIFNALKDPKKDEVSLQKLFLTIEEAGIRREDPRLKESMRRIGTMNAFTHEKTHAAGYLALDLSNFIEVMQENVVIMNRILQKDLCIPEFSKFTSEIGEIFEECRLNKDGKVADYIPQLARFSPDYWGAALCTVDGQRHCYGDYNIPFCLQSTSKALTYALAITEHGRDEVHKYVGFEPSGFSFNHITLNRQHIPHNPLINAGAIITCSLVKRLATLADRFDHVIGEYKRMAGYEFIGYSNTTFLSERDNADRNFALAYYMRENGCFPPPAWCSTQQHPLKTTTSYAVPQSIPRISNADLNDTLDFYFQLCSVETTCDSLSVIAATLANGGICPITGERVLTNEAVRDTLSLMHSCGMYDYSGQFAFKCGLPAKSGVSGVILLVVPNLFGCVVWSPPLDKQGNSVRGLQFCHKMVEKFNFHNYDSLLHSEEKVDPRKFNVDDAGHDIVFLLFAAYHDDVHALRGAYLRGQDLEISDYDGRTALHIAAAEGNTKCVEFLLNVAEVNASPKDRWGFTPLDEAIKFQHEETIKILQKVQKVAVAVAE